MSPEEIRLQCLGFVVQKAPGNFSAAHVIAVAKQLEAYVSPDTPPKRGPGRPPKPKD